MRLFESYKCSFDKTDKGGNTFKRCSILICHASVHVIGVRPENRCASWGRRKTHRIVDLPFRMVGSWEAAAVDGIRRETAVDSTPRARPSWKPIPVNGSLSC